MLDKSQIAGIKQPDVVNFIFNHRQPLHAHPESETLPFIRVNLHIVKNFRMDHPRSGNLQPLALELHIHLHARLNERKITGAESDIYIFIAKKSPQKYFYNGPLRLARFVFLSAIKPSIW